jgi:hypothetical protein
MVKTVHELRQQCAALKKRLREGATLTPREHMRLRYLATKYPTSAHTRQKYQQRQKRRAEAAQRLAEAQERAAEKARVRAVAEGAKEARRIRGLSFGVTHIGASARPELTAAASRVDDPQHWDFKGWGRYS